MIKKYDAIVIGGGHAGIEAAFALSKKNHSTLLITLDKNHLASMPCNPSIGGPAKGIITREIDALGGMQGILADEAAIQIKMLNTSKGQAVRALRAQIDKEKYMQIVLEHALKQKNLSIYEGMVSKFIWENKVIIGVELENKEQFLAKVFVITTGTYLNAYVMRGSEKVFSGPDQKKSSHLFSEELKKMGLKTYRLKTGTPPRIWSSSIDFSQVEEEMLNLTPLTFSYLEKFHLTKQAKCWLTYTNSETKQIIQDNLNKSSLYSGVVTGIGPRYCPSIEDKIVRFHDKLRHQLFLEPETIRGDVIYLSGFSTSMPIEVQEKMLHTLPGFANANVKAWAYAIEYDAIDSLELNHALASKKFPNLFFAGQINGTSGYEEAACQGLIAGINAGQLLENNPFLILKRNEAYIGVLIDDLVIKGTKEPYRMLTSRAEYRLLLRNDNADLRLSKYGYQVGLISKSRYKSVQEKQRLINEKLKWLLENNVSNKSLLAKKYKINGETYLQVLRRPEVDPKDVLQFQFLDNLTIEVRLDGYIKKQNLQVEKMLRLENLEIPKDLDYDKVVNIASEARQKLKIICPENLGQASRISGINPTDIQMIMYHLKVKSEN